MVQDTNPLGTVTNRRILSSWFNPFKSQCSRLELENSDVYLLVYSEGESTHHGQRASCRRGSCMHSVRERAECPCEKLKDCDPADTCLNPCSAQQTFLKYN